MLELVRNLMAHGDAREGKWRGNWWIEWVASTLTTPPNMVYPALLKLMRTPRLPAVDWTDAPTDLNGLVCFGERRILVSARVSSRSARAILPASGCMLHKDAVVYFHIYAGGDWDLNTDMKFFSRMYHVLVYISKSVFKLVKIKLLYNKQPGRNM